MESASEELLGQSGPHLRVVPPGPESRTWLTRAARCLAPMGPLPAKQESVVHSPAPGHTVVFQRGVGSNVFDVDGNRYVDLAAGFGALLLGHSPPAVLTALELQAHRLLQAQGDVYPSDAKIGLSERLCSLFPEPGARVILGQSGADAVTAALKTAVLVSGRPGVIAFRSSYHGLSYAPLAASGLRESYRAPFVAQLNPHVQFLDYPIDANSAERLLQAVKTQLALGNTGAVLIEPILGRGGVIVPPAGFLAQLAQLAKQYSALLIADEIWTGLGRSGELLYSHSQGVTADVVCLGKGMGGGLPISACIGRGEVMGAWRQDSEVVHTATFAGAPLACATALITLNQLSQHKLIERSRELGERFKLRLQQSLIEAKLSLTVRGAGLMIAVDLGGKAGAAVALSRTLLEHGYLVSTGGGEREVLVLTPALTIREELLIEFCPVLIAALQRLG
ncbi:MAG TPA: aspartate aminotransferase family protein [Polyangiaceae bacterium]|nr:aspartate aminotransferase family protein [Polyangiaceae bacterium]